MRCIDLDCLSSGGLEHHVVYKQHLKQRWKSGLVDRERWPSMTALVRDPRNLVDICKHHHERHHDQGRDRLYATMLPDEAIEFAFELLGAFAYDYLGRRYQGPDPRLERLLRATAA